MKKLILSLIAILTITLTMEAQRQQRGNMGTPEEMAKKQTERMKEDLSLNEDQITKVSAINLKYNKKFKEMRKNASGDRTAMREAMMTVRKERNAEMKKVLTEEQYEKMLAKEKEMMKQRKGQGRGQGKGRF